VLIAEVGAVRSARAGVVVTLLAGFLGCASGSSDDGGGASAGTGGAGASSGPGAGGDGSGATGGQGSAGSGGLGCFSTEATCGGKCVDLQTSVEHCGDCDQPCAGGPNATGECVAGECVSGCAAGYVDDQGACKNLLGSHEPYPAACPGCSTPNVITGTCGCPAMTTALQLDVQSDCPSMPLRAATKLQLCMSTGVAASNDFGGAYQVDDFDGWCGASAKCRVGNPMAAGACACPDGFVGIGLRSIIRICDDSEVGTTIYVCGNQSAELQAFGGAFQVDDFAPACRVANPWTGTCTCPAGTQDRSHRVMVDGGEGLYGSTLHLCTP
jgi:hypothetical protein